jgi:hypothetical protein
LHQVGTVAQDRLGIIIAPAMGEGAVPRDRGSGLWFEWRLGADGRRFRDFTYDEHGNVQVDPAFASDDDPPPPAAYVAMPLEEAIALLTPDPGETVH